MTLSADPAPAKTFAAVDSAFKTCTPLLAACSTFAACDSVLSVLAPRATVGAACSVFAAWGKFAVFGNSGADALGADTFVAGAVAAFPGAELRIAFTSRWSIGTFAVRQATSLAASNWPCGVKTPLLAALT